VIGAFINTDINGNGFDLADLAAILAFAVALGGVLMPIGVWLIKRLRHMVREEVQSATVALRENNGGKALPDVADRLTQVETLITQMAADNRATRELVTTFIELKR